MNNLQALSDEENQIIKEFIAMVREKDIYHQKARLQIDNLLRDLIKMIQFKKKDVFLFTKLAEIAAGDKEMNKCKNCVKLTKNKKYCCHKCEIEYFIKHKKGMWSKQARKKLTKTNIKNKTGFFSNTSIWKAHQTMKNKKIGIYNKENKLEKSLKAARTMKIRKTGLYKQGVFSKAGKRGIETQRKLKIGCFFNPVLQKISSEKGIYNTRLSNRHNKKIIFNGIFFDSIGECEIAMCIHYQIEKLIEGYNCKYKIGLKEIDFYIRKYNIFLEFHPIVKCFNRKETAKSYYYSRKKILQNNGYYGGNLIVLQ